MAKLKFKETQRFRHWEVIALLAILSLGTAIRLAVSAVSDASTDGSTILLGIFLLVSLLLTLTYFLKVKMKVRVDSKGIKYSIYPWNKNKHKIKWKDVENIEIIDSPEQAALSGWFVQYGSRTRGWNMGNHKGLRIELSNGDNYFLSINNLDELEDTIEEILEPEES